LELELIGGGEGDFRGLFHTGWELTPHVMGVLPYFTLLDAGEVELRLTNFQQ
jgi:hypothetical protein